MVIKPVTGVKINTMKFKVINERKNRVVAMNLDIHEARKIARAHNAKQNTDMFTINSQLDKPHRNGEEISEVIKREIKELLTNMINQYPNDASLGAEIRKYNKQ